MYFIKSFNVVTLDIYKLSLSLKEFYLCFIVHMRLSYFLS